MVRGSGSSTSEEKDSTNSKGTDWDGTVAGFSSGRIKLRASLRKAGYLDVVEDGVDPSLGPSPPSARAPPTHGLSSASVVHPSHDPTLRSNYSDWYTCDYLDKVVGPLNIRGLILDFA